MNKTIQRIFIFVFILAVILVVLMDGLAYVRKFNRADRTIQLTPKSLDGLTVLHYEEYKFKSEADGRLESLKGGSHSGAVERIEQIPFTANGLVHLQVSQEIYVSFWGLVQKAMTYEGILCGEYENGTRSFARVSLDDESIKGVDLQNQSLQSTPLSRRL